MIDCARTNDVTTRRVRLCFTQREKVGILLDSLFPARFPRMNPRARDGFHYVENFLREQYRRKRHKRERTFSVVDRRLLHFSSR